MKFDIILNRYDIRYIATVDPTFLSDMVDHHLELEEDRYIDLLLTLRHHRNSTYYKLVNRAIKINPAFLPVFIQTMNTDRG